MAVWLVTGAAGFIGSNFVRMAVEQGHSVIGLDALTYAGHRESIQDIENFELVVGNINNTSLVSSLLEKHRPNALINFAAESHVDRSIDGPDRFIESNVVGTTKLLQASLEYWKKHHSSDFRYIQISTDEVYGSLTNTGAFTETSPIKPSSPYSASKAAADHFVLAWHHTYGLPTVITRCSNNYGPYQFPEKLIPVVIQKFLSRQNIPVYGQGQNVRDWIHVNDHCRGITQALKNGRTGQIYNLGGRCELSNIDLVRWIVKKLEHLCGKEDFRNSDQLITFVTDRLGHDLRYAIDPTYAQKEIGFVSSISFEQGMTDTLNWYLQNSKWTESVLRAAKEKK